MKFFLIAHIVLALVIISIFVLNLFNILDYQKSIKYKVDEIVVFCIIFQLILVIPAIFFLFGEN